MRITRKSPRRSDAFKSRFLDAAHDAAPLRHARQLREYLAGQVVQAVLAAGFLVALVFFARAVTHLFERHGGDLSPWYLRLSLAGILVCFLLFLRRLIGRLREIREVRQQLSLETRKLRDLREELRRRSRGSDDQT